MTQQTLVGTYDPRFDVDALREREADYTPRPVVRQLFSYLSKQLHYPPVHMLDPAAGAGVFGQVCREVFPRTVVDSVEIAEHEAALLRKQRRRLYPDAVFEGRLQEYASANAGRVFFSLIAGNPPFSQAAEFVELLRPMLTTAPLGQLVLLLPRGWADRSEDKHAWQMQTNDRGDYINLHSVELRIPGGISFRSTGGSAFQDYAWHIWGPRPKAEPCVAVRYLERLPPDARRWKTIPGTEKQT